MAQGGEAFAREASGRVIFVPYAIAGETASVEIKEARRGFARGRIVKLLDASPDRITPRCPHFPPSPHPLTAQSLPVGEQAVRAYCGGCQYQHISYPAQLRFKTQIVRDQFARVAKMPHAPVLPILPAQREWFYRNHMHYAVNPDGALCLQAPDSHTLVPIHICYIQDEPIAEMFRTLELDGDSFDGVTLRAAETTGDKFIILESDDPETPEIETDDPVSIAFRSRDRTIPILGKETLTEKIGDRPFRISPDSFFQVNTAMAQKLVELVSEFLAPRPDEILLDAYGGVGLFGITIAPHVLRVIEIEENPTALEDARANARHLTNVQFHRGRVEIVLPKLDSPIHLAVVDPPRAGLERVALDALAVKKPRAIAYVSCDTATLSRDVARFIEHGYHLRVIQPVDLFPQTYHIECVAWLERG